MPRGATIPRPKAGIDPNSLPLFLTMEQAAEVTGISRSSVYDAIRRGQMPSVRFGRRIRIPRFALLNMGRDGEAG